MTPSPENIAYAKHLANSIGFKPTVYPYYDENKSTSIDILELDDPLDEHVKFYGSIGLSDYPNIIEMKDGSKKNIPIELLITGYKQYDKVPNILSTICFFIIKDQWTSQPGSVYKNMISYYYELTDMKHILCLTPFLWEDKLENLIFGNKNIYPLLLIPISEKELEYKLANGSDALEELFQKEQIDFFDLNRNSIL